MSFVPKMDIGGDSGVDIARSVAEVPILSFGHSNTPFVDFLALLEEFEREVVVDVRSVPYTRFAHHFSRENIRPLLRESGLRYLYLGDLLGAGIDIPDEPTLERDARIRRGMDRVIDGSRKFKIALMCAESTPFGCHRVSLLGVELERRGIDLPHVCSNRQVLFQHDIMRAPEESPSAQLRLDDTLG